MTIGRKSRPASFAAKLVAALALAALADWLFYRQYSGATVGLFAFAWAAAMLIVVKPVRRRWGAFVAMLAALYFAATLIDYPGLLGWSLFWVSLSSAALLTRLRFDDAWRWAQRLLLHVSLGIIRPFGDAVRRLRVRGPSGMPSIGRLASILALPVIGGAVFVALFAGANPLIGDLFARIHVDSPFSAIPHLFVTAAVFMAIWPSFRPHPRATSTRVGAASLDGLMPRVPLASIILSLITFNLIFAVQNALDAVFLWSGAPLPGTITMADYAHRGAYSLIATALLAGLFVLTVLRPDSESAKRPAIRLLVALWVAQNLMLVASSILRTLDYIGSYSLTELRIAALAWMVLVGIGLVLILWRLLTGRTAAWLINANALMAGLVLAVSCAVDFGAIAAQWNVRHAREVGGKGIEIDLCYLRLQGPPALLPLIELEGRVAGQPLLLDRVRAIRAQALDDMILAQSDWHSWTWRNARRLDLALRQLGPNPAAPRPVQARNCDGSEIYVPEAEAREMMPGASANMQTPLTQEGR
ncbi:DUF4173 domain-containing protein [Sphingomonas sp. AOB5]|uniref:DUF4153 domain-containing protein n=1 Tax=Sphingomonas sp. AOB5 TaxID=3034017 RepID=UPI0023F9F03D|nr:DUF4173 domain-containing protein [Sphingomonas sp. AOB5]MDF7776312.1 DUF4173 domain-containing protein [Sphingomonas sp. AOB5]